MVNWTDKCFKCGVNIFNGIPDGEDITQYIEKKKKEGWIIGYKEKPIGSFGNVHNIPIKPICTICSQKESMVKKENDTKKAMKKVAKIIKKEFSCPCCEHSALKGYNIKIFKSSNKDEMMKHIEKHGLHEIKEIIPYENGDE